MKPLLIPLLACLFFTATAQSQFVAWGNCNVPVRHQNQAADDKPSIVYLEWFDNNLLVLGYAFQEGATILINGQRLKTRNADVAMSSYFISPSATLRSQGFFRVNNAGQFNIQAVGSPQCLPLPPERCTIAGSSDKRFQVTIIVE